jgi:hypothetical protein
MERIAYLGTAQIGIVSRRIRDRQALVELRRMANRL